MKEIVFATNNKNKLEEIRKILAANFKVLGLFDIGYHEDITETGLTLRENASIKSYTIYQHYKINCFSDDTGLEVEALNNQPGVYSARFAGKDSSYDANVEKLLNKMKNCENRVAAFSTVISLILNGHEYFFEGRIKGIITTEQYGKGGFGYDPVFIPDGYNITFAQMSSELKNSISHRALATKKLVSFLKNWNG
jgi:XTP/dITP diphosphohydrolase